jgi:hypothetical protein
LSKTEDKVVHNTHTHSPSLSPSLFDTEESERFEKEKPIRIYREKHDYTMKDRETNIKGESQAKKEWVRERKKGKQRKGIEWEKQRKIKWDIMRHTHTHTHTYTQTLSLTDTEREREIRKGM